MGRTPCITTEGNYRHNEGVITGLHSIMHLRHIVGCTTTATCARGCAEREIILTFLLIHPSCLRRYVTANPQYTRRCLLYSYPLPGHANMLAACRREKLCIRVVDNWTCIVYTPNLYDPASKSLILIDFFLTNLQIFYPIWKEHGGGVKICLYQENQLPGYPRNG